MKRAPGECTTTPRAPLWPEGPWPPPGTPDSCHRRARPSTPSTQRASAPRAARGRLPARLLRFHAVAVPLPALDFPKATRRGSFLVSVECFPPFEILSQFDPELLPRWLFLLGPLSRILLVEDASVIYPSALVESPEPGLQTPLPQLTRAPWMTSPLLGLSIPSMCRPVQRVSASRCPLTPVPKITPPPVIFCYLSQLCVALQRLLFNSLLIYLFMMLLPD